MARAGITYSDVKKAVDAIEGRGLKVTYDRVRTVTGGSNSSIKPHLDALRGGLDTPAAGLVDNLEETLMDAVRSLYSRMQAEAKADLEQARIEHTEEIRGLSSQLHEMKIKYAEALQSSKAITDEFSSLRSQLVGAQALAQEPLSKIGVLEAAAQATTQNLADRAAEIHELRKQVSVGRDQFEYFSTETNKKMQQDASAYEARIDRLQKDLDEKNTQIPMLNEQRTQFEMALHLERTAHSASRDECRSLRTAEQAAQKALALSIANTQHLEKNIDEKRADSAAAREQLDKLLGELQEARVRLAERDGVIDHLKAQVQSTESLLSTLIAAKLSEKSHEDRHDESPPSSR